MSSLRGLRDVLWLIVYPLAMAGLFVGRRFGDRVQALLSLALGSVLVVVSAWDLAVNPWPWDWLSLATGAFAIVVASILLRRPRGRPPASGA
jgi:peptidoglycan/LPS O-acetylase OafA/YrhL